MRAHCERRGKEVMGQTVGVRRRKCRLLSRVESKKREV